MSLRLLSIPCMAFAVACWQPITTTAQEKQPTPAPAPMATVEAGVEVQVAPAGGEDTAPVKGVETTELIQGEELDTRKAEEPSEPTPALPEASEDGTEITEAGTEDKSSVIEESGDASVQPGTTDATINAGATSGDGSIVQYPGEVAAGNYDETSYDYTSFGGQSYDAPLATYYAPQYYGYYGNFYSSSVNFFGFRGWSMWRMWTPALNTAGVAPTAYPHFYAAHYAAYPHLYYNPYRYYPTYYYPAASFGSSYYYSVQPSSSLIITQPYMPLLGAKKTSTTPATNAVTPVSVKNLVAAIKNAEPQPESAATPEIKLVTARTTIATKADRSVSRKEEAAAFSNVYHAYWRGDNKDALQQVQAAIEASPQSARAWYYKGMIEMRMNQKENAVVSLAQAVKLHMDNPSQDADVNHALERVQGRIRVQLHRARLKAESARRSQKN